MVRCADGELALILGPAEAVNKVAEILGMSPVSVRYVMLLLQRDTRGLWPKFGKGTRASVRLRHLTNLWLACILSVGHSAAGAEAVYNFGQLIWRETDVEKSDSNAVPKEGVNSLARLAFPLRLTKTREYFDPPAGSEYWLIDTLISLVTRIVEGILAENTDWGLEREWPVIRVSLSTPMTAEMTWANADGNGSHETDHYRLHDDLLAGTDVTVDHEKPLPETQIVIRRNVLMVLARLAVRTEDFDELLRLTFAPGPASSSEDENVPKTKEATGPASRGDLNVKPSTSRALTALAPTARTHEQSDTNQPGKQSACSAVGHGSRVRQPATRKVLHHETWAAASYLACFADDRSAGYTSQNL